MERPTRRRRQRRGGVAKDLAREPARAPNVLVDEPDAPPPDAALPASLSWPGAARGAEVSAPESFPREPELVLPLTVPETAFAARVETPAPEPPLPASRRAIFFDVENTSSTGQIERLIEHLAIDRLGRRTEFIAVGNWRVIGHETARLLARHGAQLVHSAPSTGVRDWSDLRIAVSAGAWLAGARPGDLLEIVSDDRAFDAVGDVAAAIGIAFRRLSSRALSGGVEAAAPATPPAGERRSRRGQRGRRAPAAARELRRAEGRHHPPAPAAHPGDAHTTPHDELVHVVRELAERSPTGAVLIDTLSRELKARGFSRPPGSPRLVTRLRRIKELSVSPTGMISLAAGSTHAAPVADPAEETRPAEASPRRRSRRGGRRRRRSSAEGAG